MSEVLAILVDPGRTPEAAVQDLYQRIGRPALGAALHGLREMERLEDRGYLQLLTGRHAHVARYLPAFMALPFEAWPGNQELMRGLELIRLLKGGD